MKVFQTSSCLSYLLLPTSSLLLLSPPPCDIKSMLHAIDGLVEVAKEAVDVSKLPVSSGRRLRVVIVSEILLIYNTWNT